MAGLERLPMNMTLLSSVLFLVIVATTMAKVDIVQAFSLVTVSPRPPDGHLSIIDAQIWMPSSSHRYNRRHWHIQFRPIKMGIPFTSLSNAPNDGDTSSNSNSKKQMSYASISSDGIVTRGGGGNNKPRPTGSLGIPKKGSKDVGRSGGNNGNFGPGGTNMSKKDRQRTANGTIDSSSSSQNNPGNVPNDQQGIQVVRGTRGSKTVTIVRGMVATSTEEKKEILKLLKSKLGVGGTLVDGVLEIQGTHTDKVVDILKGLGYTKARRIGN